MLQVYSEHNGQYQGLDKLLNGYKKLTTNFGNINCILYNLLGFMFRTIFFTEICFSNLSFLSEPRLIYLARITCVFLNS